MLQSDWSPPEVIAKNSKIWKTFHSKCTRTPAKTQKNGHDWKNTWKELTNNDLCYLTKADKGGKLVFWNKDDYRKEGLRQLEDQSTYREIKREELEQELGHLFARKLQIANELLAYKNISEPEAKRLKESEWEIPCIYFLPKIHKDKRKDTNTFVGRPIIGAFKGCLKALDDLLAKLTSPILNEIPGSLIDTRSLIIALDKLKDIPAGAILFSADVEALYPSIPWEEGIKASTWLYSTKFHMLRAIAIKENHLPPPSPRLFKKILELILTKNYFHFQGDKWFHQIKGTAMGCSISVFLANAFMYWKTRNLIRNPPKGLIFMGRYIDDIIGIYDGDKDDIKNLFEEVTDDNIRLTYVIDPGILEALDLLIWIDEGKVITRLFRKPTDGHQYLHWHSNHPTSLKKSIPYSQLLRIRRNCSRDADYEKEAELLLTRFRNREYPEDILKRAKIQADLRNRSSLLIPFTDPNPSEDTTHTLVIQYHPETENQIREALSDLRKQLDNVLDNKDSFRVAFEIPEALGDSIGPPLKRGNGVAQFGRKEACLTILNWKSSSELTTDEAMTTAR